MTETLGLSQDLGAWSAAAAGAVAAFGLLLLGLELRRSRSELKAVIAITGMAAALLSLCAVLRPVRVWSRGTRVGPKVVALIDRSRSMLIRDGDQTREERARKAIEAIQKSAPDARLSLIGFGDRVAPFSLDDRERASGRRSDLAAALREVMSRAEEAPQALVVVSDGRLDAPGAEGVEPAMKALLEGRATPVHAVQAGEREPRDASVRAVRTAGAAVAHQPMSLQVEVGCSESMACDAVTVTVRELLDGAPPALLASGIARVVEGKALVDLQATLDRAGPRLVEVKIEAPEGDEVPENNRRILSFDVARERVRLLHVAGRPTYDVRALRTWLKSNASVDVIAFFILRADRSDVHAQDNELALIRFPVDELFTEQLPSFDAVVLQDFNAESYHLLKHLPNLARYVEGGGGLVMVGGPGAFLGGRYQNTDIERVLPVSLRDVAQGAPFDLGSVVPRPTTAGKAAPMLAPLRGLFGDELPSMPGVNLVGEPRPGALVLWEHPERKTPAGKPMPLLSLSEVGDGRSVAIAVDGIHRLSFSEFAERAAGRGHGAFWDGLLGWLMRDPRFEPAQIELPSGCISGEPAALRVVPLPGMDGKLSIEVSRAGESKASRTFELPQTRGPVDMPIGVLEAGGYMARVRVGGGSSTRRAFACEAGGEEWADLRPDPRRMKAIAAATGGQWVRASDAGSLRFPAAAELDAERSIRPLLPPWLWTLAAAAALGSHWLARRRGGLA